MIKMIHSVTGVEMWVHENNVDKFLERGHKLAPTPKPPAKKKPVKRARK